MRVAAFVVAFAVPELSDDGTLVVSARAADDFPAPMLFFDSAVVC